MLYRLTFNNNDIVFVGTLHQCKELVKAVMIKSPVGTEAFTTRA